MSTNKQRPKKCVICKRKSAQHWGILCALCYDDNKAEIDELIGRIPDMDYHDWERAVIEAFDDMNPTYYEDRRS